MAVGADSWVFLVGTLEARPVMIATATDVASRLRELQNGSPVRLHNMWQTRGGQELETALHQRFRAYRLHGKWLDFGADHPVAAIATHAVELGHRAYPSTETETNRPVLPSAPDVAEARQLAALMREAFTDAGDPPALPLAQLLEHLRAAAPDVWCRWDDRPDRLARAGRAVAGIFRSARLDIAIVRLKTPGRPSGYRLDQVERAAAGMSVR
ncbi:GIY-YIG nuclease family protein [Streptomyces anulatus]|uniref:GIY-YIG nuclease family protein n=1 Tax=Streptomyces anulatus TaxID=1892 RepID=UPI003649CB76